MSKDKKAVWKATFLKSHGHVDMLTGKYQTDGYKQTSMLVTGNSKDDAERELRTKVVVHKVIKIEECKDNVLGVLCPELLNMKFS